jgi:tripartite-type tricarboxylate transporter receptor subunit TctC
MIRISVLALLLVLSTAAHAQSAWPNRQVRLLVPNSTGSAPDFVARVGLEMLSRTTGQQWVVDNRPGGEGIIAAEAASKSAPDGYTFFFATITPIAITPHLKKSLPYDPMKDFTAVAMVIDSGPNGIAVDQSLPVKSLPELIAYSRANPGKLSYGFTVSFLRAMGAWLTNATRMDMVPIVYKDTGQAIQDSIAGRVPVMLNAMPTIEQAVQSGKMRMIAVTSAKRLAKWPEVPTVGETVPGYEANAWLSFAARAGTPAEIVNRVNKEMNVIVRDAQFQQRLEKFAWANVGGANNPPALAKFYRDEYDKWGKILRDAGVRPE